MTTKTATLRRLERITVGDVKHLADKLGLRVITVSDAFLSLLDDAKAVKS